MALLIQAAQQADRTQTGSTFTAEAYRTLTDRELRALQKITQKLRGELPADTDTLAEFLPVRSVEDEINVIASRQQPEREPASAEAAPAAPAAVSKPFGQESLEQYRLEAQQRQQQEHQQAQDETPSLHVDELRRPASERGPFDWTN